ncbi:MAG: hypothetical protein CM1200mP30_29330 [Pseudomonadota bacterium]|nr:MAG: hypothetical protein CM1200mP30_29330 [Pseudomonadota bacterium]
MNLGFLKFYSSLRMKKSIFSFKLDFIFLRQHHNGGMMSDEEKMTVFVTSGPDTPQRCATPFYMANMLLQWTMKPK